MKKFRWRSMASVLLVTAVLMNAVITAEASPSASTWWPPGGSLLENEDIDAEEITEDDRDGLGKGFLWAAEEGIPSDTDSYKAAQGALREAVKVAGYKIAVGESGEGATAQLMPIAAYKITRREPGAEGPVEFSMGVYGGSSENSIKVATLKTGSPVYALHYTNNNAWELLKATIEADDRDGSDWPLFAKFKANSLSPFYFFVAMDPLDDDGEIVTVELEPIEPEPTATPAPTPAPTPEPTPAPTPEPDDDDDDDDEPAPTPEPVVVQPPVQVLPEKSHKTGRE